MIIARKQNTEDILKEAGSSSPYTNYAIMETLESGYDDVTNVSTWFNIVTNCIKDYVYMRDFAKATFLPAWDTLSTPEKAKLVQHYIYPDTFTQEEIDVLFTAEEQLGNWEYLALKTKEVRGIRWEELRKKISFDLSVYEGLLFYSDTKQWKGDYIDADLPYLELWFVNGIYPPLGIDFTTNGFAQKSYYSEYRKDLCVDVVTNGNY